MGAALTIAIGLLVITLETVLLRVFGIVVWAPQLAVAAVTYVALRRSFAVGALSTFIFAAVADLCWGGPRGYYALGLTAAFFALTVVRTRWRPRALLAVALLIAPAVVVSDIVALVALLLFRHGVASLLPLISVSPLDSLLTAVTAMPILWVCLRIDRFVERRQHEGVAFG